MKNGTFLAIILLTLVALAHLLRIVFAVPATVGNYQVPQWISLFGIVVPGLIAVLLWKESQ